MGVHLDSRKMGPEYLALTQFGGVSEPSGSTGSGGLQLPRAAASARPSVLK